MKNPNLACDLFFDVRVGEGISLAGDALNRNRAAQKLARRDFVIKGEDKTNSSLHPSPSFSQLLRQLACFT